MHCGSFPPGYSKAFVPDSPQASAAQEAACPCHSQVSCAVNKQDCADHEGLLLDNSLFGTIQPKQCNVQRVRLSSLPYPRIRPMA